MKTNNLLSRLKWFRLCSFSGPKFSVFKVEYWPGDDSWKASIQCEHWWPGERKWHVLFLPW